MHLLFHFSPQAIFIIFFQIFACKQRFLEVNYLYGRFSTHLRSRCRYTLHSPEWEIPRPTNICQPAGHQDAVVAHALSRLILSTLFDIMQRYITNFWSSKLCHIPDFNYHICWHILFQARVIRHHHRQPGQRATKPVWQMVRGTVRGEGSLCKVYMEAGIPSWGGGPLLWLLKARRDWSAQVPDNHNLICAGLPLSWTRWPGWNRVNYLQLMQGNQFSNLPAWFGMVFQLPIIVQLFKIFSN